MVLHLGVGAIVVFLVASDAILAGTLELSGLTAVTPQTVRLLVRAE